MAKKKQGGVERQYIAPLALAAAVLVGGATLAYTDSTEHLMAAVGNTLLPSSTSPLIETGGKGPLYTFSYTGLDKGDYGPQMTVPTQAKASRVTVAVALDSASIKALKTYTKGGALAYASYDVYPAYVTRTAGARNVAPIFSSAGRYSLTAKGTSVSGALPLDFASNVLPDQLYTVHVRVMAADSSFNVDDYIYVLVENTAQCQLKG